MPLTVFRRHGFLWSLRSPRLSLNISFQFSVSLAHGALLDALFVICSLENGVNENPRRVHAIWFELADVNKLFHFRDNVISSGGHHRIEVPRRLAEGEVAPAVALPRLDECEVAAQRLFEHASAAVEFAHFFSFADHRA